MSVNSSYLVTLLSSLVWIAFNLILLKLMGIRDYPFPSKDVLQKFSLLANIRAFLSSLNWTAKTVFQFLPICAKWTGNIFSVTYQEQSRARRLCSAHKFSDCVNVAAGMSGGGTAWKWKKKVPLTLIKLFSCSILSLVTTSLWHSVIRVPGGSYTRLETLAFLVPLPATSPLPSPQTHTL